ncbi:dioxygenase [Wolbachia pipientis]|uniref:Dioxygenase n=1 Tax=Wolbachia pipientis TaxID=955 RepID=A0A1E7QJH3_WOLPI|nr:protocatechuate 3,4-dioxygenase [Wolbachia pipientis]OEY86632.1 dioxygenase [Wolbachia pipientis]
MKKYFLLLLLAVLISNLQTFANDPILLNCIETPSVYSLDTCPNKLGYSNNLRRRPGSSDVASGELIHIVGRVTDINCLPIQNAVVHIWHADACGYNENMEQNAEPHDPNFAESGRFITNNLGYYHFITIMPGTNGERAPHVNFLVQHPDFPEFTTQMFFADLNYTDPILTNLPKAHLLIATFSYNKKNIKTYTFNITLGGYNKFSSTR